MINYPQKMLDFILSCIFPVRCIECGKFSPENDKKYLCKDCVKLIPIRKNFECIGCKMPAGLGRTCIECDKIFAVDQLLIISDYKNPILQKAIKALKYRFIKEVAESLYPVIRKYLAWLSKEKKLNLLSDNPLLMPIPLHATRRNMRGFNQAELIAALFAKAMLAKVENKLVVRHKDSKPQANLENKEQRLDNIRDAFRLAVPGQIDVDTIILVDDVCTTGATLNEAAKLLKENGVKKVVGLVVARG